MTANNIAYLADDAGWLDTAMTMSGLSPIDQGAARLAPAYRGESAPRPQGRIPSLASDIWPAIGSASS